MRQRLKKEENIDHKKNRNEDKQAKEEEENKKSNYVG